jgi:hypothetical protein
MNDYWNRNHPLRKCENQWITTGATDTKTIASFLNDPDDMKRRLAAALLAATTGTPSGDPMVADLKQRRNATALRQLMQT